MGWPGASQENPHQEGSRMRTSVQQSWAERSTASGLPGTVKLGAWVHTGSFADQRFNAQSGLLAASSANPLQHAGNFAVYGVIDQMLWRADGSGSDRGLNFFLRASAAPSDRNLINLYFDTGLTFKALSLRGRTIPWVSALRSAASRRRRPRAIVT